MLTDAVVAGLVCTALHCTQQVQKRRYQISESKPMVMFWCPEAERPRSIVRGGLLVATLCAHKGTSSYWREALGLKFSGEHFYKFFKVA